MMPKKTYSITVSALIEAAPGEIWKTWKTPNLYNHIHQTHKAEIDFQVGGTIRVLFFADKADGETFVYQEIIPESKLVFAWQESPHHSATVLLTPVEKSTEVSVTQDCQDDPAWIQNCLDGWAWGLDSMAHYFQTGDGLSHKAWQRHSDSYQIVKLDT